MDGTNAGKGMPEERTRKDLYEMKDWSENWKNTNNLKGTKEEGEHKPDE